MLLIFSVKIEFKVERIILVETPGNFIFQAIFQFKS